MESCLDCNGVIVPNDCIVCGIVYAVCLCEKISGVYCSECLKKQKYPLSGVKVDYKVIRG